MKFTTLIVIALISCVDASASSETTTEKRTAPPEETSVLPTWYPKEALPTAGVNAINKARENSYLEYMSCPENTRKPRTVIVGSGRGSIFQYKRYAANFYGNKANDLLLLDTYAPIAADLSLDVRKISQLHSNTYDYVISEYAPSTFTYSPQAINGAINILKSGGKLVLPFPGLIARPNWWKHLNKWTGRFRYFLKRPLKLRNGDLFLYGIIHPSAQISTLLSNWHEKLRELCTAQPLKLSPSDMFSSLSAIGFLPQKPVYELTPVELENAKNAIAHLIDNIRQDRGVFSRSHYFYIAGVQYIEELLSHIVPDITDKASISLECAIPSSDMWPKKEITDQHLVVITKK